MKNLENLFGYHPSQNYTFTLPDTANNIPSETEDKKISKNLASNIEFLKTKYNLIINSDINTKNFTINISGKNYSALLVYIDGLVDSESINMSVLSPLLLRNSITMTLNQHISVKNINLENFLYNCLIPQNNIKKIKSFNDLISKLNMGFCILIVDTLEIAFGIETKKIPGRSIESAKNEAVIHGPQEAFVENIRENTALLRKRINNENLIIESLSVGKITKTQVAVCYMKNITNDDLVSEVKCHS